MVNLHLANKLTIMQNKEYNLFVYGSLRHGFNHAAYEYMAQYFNLVGPGKTTGTMYDLGPYPAAVPGDGSHQIIGELYRIKQEDEFEYAIAQLDDYEGVSATYDQPALYRRELVTVELQDGIGQKAWIYWYNGDTTGKTVVESGDVLEYLRNK